VVLVPESEVSKIRGVVVDDRETPVFEATIDLDFGRDGAILTSDRDGHFVVKRRPSDPEGPFYVSARRDGYDPGRTAQKITWG
jgi:hypothetical protein